MAMAEQTQTAERVPLIVDLENALVTADLRLERSLQSVKRGIATLRPPSATGMTGTVAGEEGAEFDAACLPYDRALVERLTREKAEGRRLILATDLDVEVADAVNQHLGGLFDTVVHGGSKAANSPAETVKTAPTPFDPVAMVKALRPHQWVKNALVFVPLLTSHAYADVGQIWMAVIAFVAFGLCASSVYVINDLLDLPDDRRHPRKRARPFASGSLRARHGLMALPVVLGLATLLSLSVSVWFFSTLAAYFLLTLAYSLALKRMAVVDVLVLAGLYTMRLIAGSVAISLWPSFWLLAFSMFVFLSLALLKRYTEILGMRQGGRGMGGGRGYRPEDSEMLASLGGSAGYLSVLVMALYINSPTVQQTYARPEALWLLCPALLYWISRAWMISHRGLMNDDPIVFAIKDRGSQVVAAGMVLVVLLAS